VGLTAHLGGTIDPSRFSALTNPPMFLASINNAARTLRSAPHVTGYFTVQHMTKIRARCPRCGDVEFGTDSIVVLIDGEESSSSYRFACPTCGDLVSRSAVPDVLALLLSAGVREESAVMSPPIPTLSEVDVESFRRLLDSDFVWDSLHSAMRADD
jgi:hypothetical protein